MPWPPSSGTKKATFAGSKHARSVAAKNAVACVVPHPSVISGYARNLLALLETDPVRGRELLSRFVAPVVMTPEGQGTARGYRATGAFNLSFFLTPTTAVEVKSGCAGMI